MQYSIEASGIKKHFGDVVAVDGLDLQIREGSIYAFLGPNGAGKTTTVKMLAGLLTPSAGTLRVAGIDPKAGPVEEKRRIGYIPDQPFLYDKLTVWEFVFLVGRFYSLDSGRITKDMAGLLDLFDLTPSRDRLVETLSHGMKKRLVFCSTLIHEPEVLLIDEPMVGLDPRNALVFKTLLTRLSGEGRTIFLSTHSLSIAEELADEIGIIHKGRLIASGTARHLKDMAQNAPDLERAFMVITGAVS